MRVTVFVARYGRLRLGWSAERAAELVGEVWRPEGVWADFLGH
jgi:hypothetical protein